VSRFVLDTDHLSLLQHKHPIILQRVAAQAPGALAITVITAEEQLRGWLAVIRQHSHTERQLWAYQGLQETLRKFNRFTLCPSSALPTIGLCACVSSVFASAHRIEDWTVPSPP
jgi:hypothetical protein